jgi:hypothetical protein
MSVTQGTTQKVRVREGVFEGKCKRIAQCFGWRIAGVGVKYRLLLIPSSCSTLLRIASVVQINIRVGRTHLAGVSMIPSEKSVRINELADPGPHWIWTGVGLAHARACPANGRPNSWILYIC